MTIIKPEHSPSINNEDALLQLVETIKQLVASSPQQLLGIKNTYSQMIYYSKAYATFLGFKSEDIIGKKTMLELYDNPNIENAILKEDDIVINEQRHLRILKINKVANNLKPYICVKSPLINPNNKQVIGILLQGFEISILNLNQYILNSYSSLQNTKQEQLPELSRRERQVIFFFMAQLTSQEIAETIHKIEGKRISKSTIDSVFNDQLYAKFLVYSRSALYDKLKSLGYDKLIPSEVLSSMSETLETISIF